jgi:hypothetical protein
MSAMKTVLIMAGGTGGHVFGSGRKLNLRCAQVSLDRKRAQAPVRSGPA